MEVDPDRPVLVDKYLDRADELDVDALCDKDGNVVICGIMQHIEQAGVHSGTFPHPFPCYHALQYACASRALSWRRGRGNNKDIILLLLLPCLAKCMLVISAPLAEPGLPFYVSPVHDVTGFPTYRPSGYSKDQRNTRVLKLVEVVRGR